MESLKELLKTEKIEDTIDFGGAEIGGIFVELNNKIKELTVIDPKYSKFAKSVIDTIKGSIYEKYLGLEEYEATVSNFIVVKDEYSKSMPKEELKKIVDGANELLINNIDKNATVLKYEKYLETFAPKIGKDKAIDFIFRKYQKDYNIRGFCYAGDSQNDLMAMKHLAKLSEVPGIEAFSIAPSNAAQVLNTDKIEGWKKLYNNKSFSLSTNKKEPRFVGIINELRLKLDKGKLVGLGMLKRETKDNKKLNLDSILKINKLKKSNSLDSLPLDI